MPLQEVSEKKARFAVERILGAVSLPVDALGRN